MVSWILTPLSPEIPPPVQVCYGVGLDGKTAHNDAARNALNYLKMMTKRSVGGKK